MGGCHVTVLLSALPVTLTEVGTSGMVVVVIVIVIETGLLFAIPSAFIVCTK